MPESNLVLRADEPGQGQKPPQGAPFAPFPPQEPSSAVPAPVRSPKGSRGGGISPASPTPSWQERHPGQEKQRQKDLPCFTLRTQTHQQKEKRIMKGRFRTLRRHKSNSQASPGAVGATKDSLKAAVALSWLANGHMPLEKQTCKQGQHH